MSTRVVLMHPCVHWLNFDFVVTYGVLDRNLALKSFGVRAGSCVSDEYALDGDG